MRGSAADEVLLPAEYAKVVELLKKRGEKGHMILAQSELGDVYAHFGMWPAAGAAWNSALDALLGPYQVVASWTRKLDLSCGWQQLLARYGVHGLLLAGMLLGKLARYIHHSDLGARLSCARLAGELLPAVFAASIIHPQRAVDCALYVPVEIWPGADLFDDPYRCNAPDLLSSLESLTHILIQQHISLPALPLLALWEHVALHATHNTPSLVLARVMRVKALSQLALLAEAGIVLRGLLQGSNLPGVLLQGPQPILGPDGVGPIQQSAEAGSKGSTGSSAADAAEVSGAAAAFYASKWPGHLDCALLDERLGARGEVDRLAAAALATSSSIVQQQGLQEMLVSAGC
ncbi:hypothetical protein OEZ85_010899 [Tetradesmus obliquus]|uniref:Rab-GAP TBC domain-containing protein n=1 Tax=Tetradesmus obliquus TaxID=3088 RepID=A0ABY8TNW4_TETOB|nr:hypothetical protein OEZ85_010899 [Tetradesmus obliquus]